MCTCLRGNAQDRVGDGDAGVEEEEQEELAVVEAHRVHHPRAEVVHVQRQPSGDLVRVKGHIQRQPSGDLVRVRVRVGVRVRVRVRVRVGVGVRVRV